MKKRGMICYCGETDAGGRKNNEDACTATHFERNGERLYLIAVADGLGGHAAGEVASNTAIIELSKTIGGGFSITGLQKTLLAEGFQKANEEVCRQAVGVRRGMGTTLVAALLNDEGKGVVANVGDSSAYLIGKNTRKMTKEHSYVQELVDRGIITQEEAAVHPEKNVVTRIIGMEGAEPDFYDVELGVNTLVLCSDGLTDALHDEEIRKVVTSSKIGKVCKNLVEAARPKSRDNITVTVARFLA